MSTTSTPLTVSSKNEKAEDIGVIIGRFQTPYLHEGHKDLILQVVNTHKIVVIMIGVSPNKRSRRNPLDFEARRVMILQDFPSAVIVALPDMQDDELWSDKLDETIKQLYPFASICLYGGRDSFITHYKGTLPTKEVATTVYTSATSLRDSAGHDVTSSAAWRAGVIYGAYNQYPKTWQTVDIAPIRYDADGNYEVLLARKPNEKDWRFIGGFVDPKDGSLEVAAQRELGEEAHIHVEGLRYISSRRINDWRYRDDTDKVITTLFAGTYVFGAPQPDDDIEELAWWTNDKRSTRALEFVSIVDAHHEIFGDLMKYLRKEHSAKVIERQSSTS